MLLHLLALRSFAMLGTIVATTGVLQAQASDIRGTVADSATGERIPYASIIVQGTGRGAPSNTSGFFLVTGIPPGTYQVTASAVGYIRQVRTVTLSGGAITLDFRLPPEAVQMQEVVVREQSKRELKEVSTSVHLMDTRDLQLVPVTLQQDVFRSVQILPGVVSSSDVSAQFYVRGGASDQNLILLDGIRVYSPYHAFGIFSIFDSDIINSTEVYTGAFPPGFGGRLSSVVNLATRDGREGSPSVRTSVNPLSAKVQVEGSLGQTGRWIVDGRRSLFPDAFRRFFRQDVPIGFYDLFAKTTFEGSGTQTRFSLLTFQTGDQLDPTNADDPSYTWRNALYGARATTLFSDRVYVNTIVSYTASSAAREPRRNTEVSPASTSVKEFAIRGDATIYTDAGSLYFVGFDFSFPSLEFHARNSSGLDRGSVATSPEIAAWVRYQTTLGAVRLDGGAHIDGGAISNGSALLNIFQPRLHASVDLNSLWRLKASYGRHTQNVITLSNEDDLIALYEAWTVVPTYLPRMEADHVIMALQGQPWAELATEVQVYAKRYGALVAYNKDKVDDNDPDYVTGRGLARGVETMVRYGRAPVDVYLAYTLGWVRVEQQGISYPPRYDRRHTIKSLIVVTPIPRLETSLRWDFGSGFPFTPTAGFYDRLRFGDIFTGGFAGESGDSYVMLGDKNSMRLPSYHRLDLSATYRVAVGRFEGSLGVHMLNLYSQKNIFYFDRRTGQRINMLPFTPSVTLQMSYQ